MSAVRLLVMVLVVGGAVAAPVAGVAAAAGNEPTATATATDTATATETPSPTPTVADDTGGAESGSSTSAGDGSENATTVVEQVDDRLRILAYSYHEEQSVFLITLENTAQVGTASVTITEAISRQAADAGRFGIKSFEVAPGEKLEIRLTVYTDNPLGVMVTTSRSVEEGHGSFLPVESGGSLIKGDATWADVRAGVLASILLSLGVLVVAAWHVYASSNDDVEQVDMEGAL